MQGEVPHSQCINTMFHNRLYIHNVTMQSLCNMYQTDLLHNVTNRFLCNMHQECRIVYCNPKAIDSSKKKTNIENSTGPPNLRFQTLFRFADRCLFCGQERYSELSAAAAQGIDINGYSEGNSVQFITDNVDHNKTEKALARAVRGHLLVDTELNALLVSMTFDIPLPDDGQYLTNEEHLQDRNRSFESSQIAEASTAKHEPVSSSSRDILSGALNLFNQLINVYISVDTICQSGVLDDINASIASKRKALEVSRSASLWMRFSEIR
ncbi:unnamed protein product [Mytilus coruscus]|uniref:Uncharacterized protein n=1 Tax=Mytilus coruscus TaxID=42192 RepID=A0A6J8CPZ6_MYTCO|nr:unnamed protein product [Mytilus coruscus]